MTNIEIQNFNFPDIDLKVKSALQASVDEVLQSIKKKKPAYQIITIHYL